MSTFGARLRIAREQARFTQDDAAQELEVSKGSLSAWENDKHFPQLEKFIQLCRLYAASADDLLFGATGIREAAPRYAEDQDAQWLLSHFRRISPARRRALIEYLKDD